MSMILPARASATTCAAALPSTPCGQLAMKLMLGRGRGRGRGMVKVRVKGRGRGRV